MGEILKIDAVTVAPSFMKEDSHFYFRGGFILEEPRTVTLKIFATSWFEVWLDGEWMTEGPARFEEMHPDYEVMEVVLAAGRHVLCFHVHYEGVDTRLCRKDVPLFIFGQVQANGEDLSLNWHYLLLEAYRKTGRRINCINGWVEWCDTAMLPEGWLEVEYDEQGWKKALPESLNVYKFAPVPLNSIQHIRQTPLRMAEGLLVNMSTFPHDPCAGFVSRQLENLTLPEQGVWSRYDLGKVRLGRPIITIDAPEGTVVQIAYTEFLINGRVSPYMSQGAGGENSCNLDHFVLSGGIQQIKPLHPKGCRYLEIHVVGSPDVAIRSVQFEERVYYGEPEGSFRCNDELLNRIWMVGVDTLRSCSEDAITDNPTRERGQWLGDVVGPGMDIASVGYADLLPLKRGLLQAAQCVGDDGMLPAIFPGTRAFLPSFAIQWIYSVPHYFELSGDFQMLKELYPSAVENIRCFDDDLSDGGLRMNPSRWNFIDWGYRGSSFGFCDKDDHHVEIDPALSLFYLKALRALIRWATLLGYAEDAEQWESEEKRFCTRMKTFLSQVERGMIEWEDVGYHSSALALDSGLLEAETTRTACVEYLKQHILSCFPNNPQAPRLHDPTVEASQLITPFFFHHVFPALIGAGEMEFVLEQFRICWGHWLDVGLTTWPEVFDLRWSHCHQWSGCPTWILSRYVLGLHPRFDLGENHYDFRLEPGDLTSAEGVLPMPYCGNTLSVSWKRAEGGIHCRFNTTVPVYLHFSGNADAIRVTSSHEKLIQCV